MALSPWLLLLLALPVLPLGEWLVARVGFLRRFSIPAPVVGGLFVAAAALAARGTPVAFEFVSGAGWRAWTWLVTVEPEWFRAPVRPVNLPFLATFYACVGLSATWRLVHQAGRGVVIFLLLVSGLAVVQNLVAVLAAKALGVSPLLGLICGSMSMTGGHATALGFAPELQRMGLASAQTLGTAAATFGLVAGALLAGPVGGGLIRRRGLKPSAAAVAEQGAFAEGGFLHDLRAIVRRGRGLAVHLLLLALCLKAGAWVSYLLQLTGMSFPVVIGTMFAGVVVRNVLDAAGARWFEPALMEHISSAALAVFLVTAMMGLRLDELASAAAPMLAILSLQVAVMAAFAWWVTFRAMGRDFDAAVMAGGHCGFGLGSTTTAVAGMKAVVETAGPAPRAFLIVPLVGGFLVDLTNAANLTAFLNLVR